MSNIIDESVIKSKEDRLDEVIKRMEEIESNIENDIELASNKEYNKLNKEAEELLDELKEVEKELDLENKRLRRENRALRRENIKLKLLYIIKYYLLGYICGMTFISTGITLCIGVVGGNVMNSTLVKIGKEPLFSNIIKSLAVISIVSLLIIGVIRLVKRKQKHRTTSTSLVEILVLIILIGVIPLILIPTLIGASITEYNSINIIKKVEEFSLVSALMTVSIILEKILFKEK